MNNFKLFFFFLVFGLIACNKNKEEPKPQESEVQMYFPPSDQNTWETIEPSSIGWKEAEITELLEYLDEKNTKGFIILKDGKIVVEKYFNGHTANDVWVWNSADKSLTSVLVGIANSEGFLDINEKSATYLGDNWSSLTKAQQDLIKLKNHLSMTTGLVSRIDRFLLWTCTDPICLQYEVDAGVKWDYHQAPFTLIQDMITNATGADFKAYCKEKLQDKIGMDGSWNESGYFRVFSSTTRSMARFGLLALNKGVWKGETIYPITYHQNMIQPSQNLNKAYGYLWWLNGKESSLSVGNSTPIAGPLFPNAPADMFCALGANDQKIYVIPKMNLVVVRCGESAGDSELANSTFDNELWGKINAIFP